MKSYKKIVNIEKELLDIILMSQVLLSALKYSEEKNEVVDGCSLMMAQILQKIKNILNNF
ncbi:MAG: hypothetical protein PHX18_04635 [Candidatus Gastranaerophilales bacterium]|nr:hypothetical protein [Candidatus Gastranaerophilales bacterium]